MPLTSVAEPKIFLSAPAPAIALAADSFIGYLDSYVGTFFDLINSIKIVTTYKTSSATMIFFYKISSSLW
jgi:hypothetical protein